MNGLKLCFSTVACTGLSEKELKNVCISHGIDGVEIRLDENSFPSCNTGLNIVDLGTGVCLLGYEPDKIKEAKAILEKIKRTDIRAIRLFLGNFAVMKTNAKKEIDYPGIVKALKELCEFTEKEIWIETHNEFATGRVLKMLAEDVGKDNLKFIWDVIHPIEDFESYTETWQYIGDRIAHVHIKDGKISKNPLKHDYDYTLLGEGELPLKEIISLLKSQNFNGYISFEWENKWRSELSCYSKDINDILAWFTSFMLNI